MSRRTRMPITTSWQRKSEGAQMQSSRYLSPEQQHIIEPPKESKPNSWKTMIGRKLGLIAKDPKELAAEVELDLDKEFFVPNREDRRRAGINTSKGYHARNRAAGRNARARTGRPKHFNQWILEGQAKKVLGRISTEEWFKQDSVPVGKAATVLQEQFPTVWDLSSAKRADLLALKGVGAGTLIKLQVALVRRTVTPSWAEREMAE